MWYCFEVSLNVVRDVRLLVCCAWGTYVVYPFSLACFVTEGVCRWLNEANEMKAGCLGGRLKLLASVSSGAAAGGAKYATLGLPPPRKVIHCFNGLLTLCDLHKGHRDDYKAIQASALRNHGFLVSVIPGIRSPA